MLGFSQIPFFRIVLCFGIGLALQLYGQWSIEALFCSFSVVLPIVLLLRIKKVAFVFRILSLSFCLVLVGAMVLELRLQKFENQPTTSQLNSFYVKKHLSSKGKWNKYEIGADNNGLLYVAKALEPLQVGQQYFAKVKKYRVEQDALPKRFDYPMYLKSKGFCFKAFVKRSDSIFVGNSTRPMFLALAAVRRAISSQLEALLANEAIKGFYSAVLLGDKSWLDEETQVAFAELGIAHFLAVSGLHVGIIYVMFSLVLGLKQYKKHQWLVAKLTLVIVAIWVYALVSGFSVSVVRASFMFTCFLVARGLKRGGNGFNILCFSAFVTLLNNPLAIHDVGFQLSYAAVASIILLHPKMQAWFTFKYRVSNFLWDAVCLSACAQLGTLPIILFTFGYFPVWFLLSNLWLAPFAFILTCSAFIFQILAFVPWVNVGFSFVVAQVYNLFLYGITLLESLPFAAINVHIEKNQMLVLLGMLGLWITYLYSKKMSAIAFAMVLAAFAIVTSDGVEKEGLQEIKVGQKKYYSYHSKAKQWLFPRWYSHDFDHSFVKNNADNSLFKDYYRLPMGIRPSKKIEMVVLRIEDGNGHTIEIELE